MNLAYFFLGLFGVSLLWLLINLKPNVKYQFSAYLEEENITNEVEKRQKSSFVKNKYINDLLPSTIIKKAAKVDWEITEKNYWAWVFISSLAWSFVMYVLIVSPVISILSLLGGFLTPPLLVYARGKKHKTKVENTLIIYMKATANSMSVHGNAINALKEVSLLVDENLKRELEKVISLLQSGKSMKEAFKDLNERYDYKELHFFHNMLEVAHQHGGKHESVLKAASDDFEQQKFLQLKLSTELTQTKKAFYQSVGMVVSMPFIFMFFMNDLYQTLTNHPGGQLVLGTVVIVIIFLSIKVEKMSQFNPHEAFKDK